jgi:hypothetical protein
MGRENPRKGSYNSHIKDLDQFTLLEIRGAECIAVYFQDEPGGAILECTHHQDT